MDKHHMVYEVKGCITFFVAFYFDLIICSENKTETVLTASQVICVVYSMLSYFKCFAYLLSLKMYLFRF